MTDTAAARAPATSRSGKAILRSTMVVSGIRGIDFGLSFLVSVLLANRFGASGQLDAFFMARRTTVGIADTIRKFVGQMVMPSVITRIDRGEPLSIHGLPRRVYFVLGGLIAAMLVGTLVPSFLISVFAPGFTGTRHALAARMMAIMMPLMPMAVFGSLLMAVLQANRRYLFSEGTNIIQRGILVLVLAIAVPPLGIVAGAWTMLIAGVIGLAILLTGAWSIVRRHPAAGPDTTSREAVAPAAPSPGGRIAGAVVLGLYAQASTLIDFAVASTVRVGGVAALEYGARLVTLVPGLLMVSLTTVLYPELVRTMQNPDPAAAAAGFAKLQRIGLFVQLPVSIGMMLGAEPMVRILFGHGAFGETGVLLTTATTAGYAAAQTFLTPLNATTAAIYADPRRSGFADLLVIAIGGILFRIAMLAVAVPLFGIAGVAGGAAAATLAGLALAQGVAMRRFRDFDMIVQLRDFARTALCGGIAATVCWFALDLMGPARTRVTELATLALIGIVVVVSYGAAATALRAPEMANFRRLLPPVLRRGQAPM